MRRSLPSTNVPGLAAPKRIVAGCAIVTFAAVIGLAGCNSDGRTLRPSDPSQNQSVYTASTTTTLATDVLDTVGLPAATKPAVVPFSLQLPWADGGAIDARFTCDGGEVHPTIAWLGAPAGAVEMALVVTDTDANDFVHWIIAGLDPLNPLVPEGSVPAGAIEGLNGFSTTAAPVTGYRGPCPPAGTTHHYRFTLTALDQQVELPTGSPAADLKTLISGSAIASAEAVGVYSRP